MTGRGSGYDCTICGYPLGGTSPVTEPGAVPKDGDASICVYCGAVAAFNDDGTLRRPTADEMREFLADDVIRQAVRSVNIANAFLPMRRRSR